MNLSFFKLKLTEIASVSYFVEDRINQKYGFTIIFKKNKIKNIYLEGNWSEQKSQVEKLKKNYNELIKQIKKAKEA